MGARAAAVEQTRRRILDTTFALSADRFISEITLDAVSQGAGVSVQTVLRQFGSRTRLLEAAAEHGSRLVVAERAVPSGDVPTALRVLLDHYELRGDAVVMMLAQESADAVVARVVEKGRALHRDWVHDVFDPLLTSVEPTAREEATDLLVVATDVYTWKLLRRDRRLSREAVEVRINQLVEAVLAGPKPNKE